MVVAYPDWLSQEEKDYVAASDGAYRAAEDAKRAEAEERQRDAKHARRLVALEMLAAANRRAAVRTGMGLIAALLLAITAGQHDAWEVVAYQRPARAAAEGDEPGFEIAPHHVTRDNRYHRPAASS